MESMNPEIVNRRRVSGLDVLENPLERIAVETCDHTMDKLRYIGTDYQGDTVVFHFECDCGKSVDEIFTILETKVY